MQHKCFNSSCVFYCRQMCLHLWNDLLCVKWDVYKCVHGAALSYLAEMCIPVAASTGRHFLCSASNGDLTVPWARIIQGQYSFAVSEFPPEMICHWFSVQHRLHWDSSNINSTILFGLWDMIRHTRDCLGLRVAPYKCSHLLTYFESLPTHSFMWLLST